MNSNITLKQIIVHHNSIEYKFDYTNNLKKFFSGKPFIVEYDLDISKVPLSILCIPFISSVLPITMLTDSIINVDDVDSDFYNCLPELARGYETMFVETKFNVRLHYKNIKKNEVVNDSNKNAMFYSGGLDSLQTLVSHYHESPDLITIWGSDIKYSNDEGWNTLYKTLSEDANNLKLNLKTIKSSFREFDNEEALDNEFRSILKDGWWHGVKHGIALIGHVAPIAYLKKYNAVYIASTNCPTDKNVRCASNPATDNAVRFCGTKICHDGFKYNRQDKARNVIQYSINNNLRLKFHVCWKTQTGDNCCLCEKCSRTIFNIMVEGANPVDFGFNNMNKFYSNFNHNSLLLELCGRYDLQREFAHIANRFRQNKAALKKNKNYKYMKWLNNLNLNELKTFNPSHWYIFKRRVRGLLRRILNKLHKAAKLFFAFFAYKKHLKNKIAIVGTPSHNNIGDLAIAVAEFDAVKECGYVPYEITYSEMKSYFRIFKSLLKNKTIVLPGGGNMGDTWFNEESLRRQVISKIKARKFIIMPQTLFYSNTPDGIEKEKESVRVYNKPSVYLMLRDKTSYAKACNLYPKANLYLACDVVLSLGHNPCCNNRNGKALLIFRKDIEKTLDSKIIESIKQYLVTNNISYDETDMYLVEPPTEFNKRAVVLSKLDEISKYDFVITDRLHGMIFSTITSTTCFAFNNETKKVEGTFEFIKSLGYIKLCYDFKDFVSNFNLLKNRKANNFDSEKIDNYCLPVIKNIIKSKS